MTPTSEMTPTRFGKPLLLGLALASAPSLVHAIEGGSGRFTLTPAQQQKMFPEWRQLSLQATQDKIAILQKHQQCLSAASSFDGMRACQRQERQALMNQRQQQREAMRQLLQRNGITPPQPRQDGGKRRVVPSQDGIPMI